MSDRQLQKLRTRLVQWMEELTTEQTLLKQELATRNTILPDPADQASQICDWHLIISRQERVRTTLRQVYQAIKQIDRGVYGICCDCGEDIGLPRLMARPSTDLCISCQEYAEHSGQGRPRGLTAGPPGFDHYPAAF